MLSTSLMPGSDFTESDPEEIKIVWESGGPHHSRRFRQAADRYRSTEDTPVVLREGVGDVRPFLCYLPGGASCAVRTRVFAPMAR